MTNEFTEETKLTAATWVVIVVPPAPPMIKAGEPSGAKKIEGLIEDCGLFPGAMKLEGDAGIPKELTVPGVEKSSISLLKMMPVLLPFTFDPKLSGIKVIV